MSNKVVSKTQAWMMAIRPKTLPAAISPVIVGTAFALYFNYFDFLPALTSLLGALLLQIAANLANDYYDFKKGADTSERIGPVRVVASGLITSSELVIGLVVTLILSIIIGLYLIWIGGIIILIIGLASIISLLAYSGLAISYGYKGLGDIFVFIFFGLIAVNGSYYVQSLEFNYIVLLGSIPPGLLITAILVVNNYRDLETDKNTGKYTLAVYMGPTITRLYYILLWILSYLTLFILYFIYDFSLLVFIPLLTIVPSIQLIRSIYKEKDGPELNITLAKTAKVGLIFNLLFSIGIVLSK